MVYPAPAVLVSCGSLDAPAPTDGGAHGDANLFTVAWTGTICTNPAMLSISVRPERHSYGLIRRDMQFTVNLTTEAMARATDWCGVRSGRDHDKWAATGLTAVPGVMNSCPYVGQSPLAIECRVKDIIQLGSHHMFIAEVLDVLADEQFIDPSTGAFDMQRAGLMAYAHGGYFALGQKLGHFGFSVRKNKKR